MKLYLLDTTTVTHLFRDHPIALMSLRAHQSDRVAISSVTVEEIVSGWISRLQNSKPEHEPFLSEMLIKSVGFLNVFPQIAVSDRSVIRYTGLRKMKLNIGRNDLRIAALALEIGATVVSDNLRDFGRVPGLACVNWLLPQSSSPPAVS